MVHVIGLPIERICYWSDSTITLQYINNKKNRLRVFEGNRVSDILEVSEASQWTHISGKENPADLITRGVTDPSTLMKGNWFPGPKFLLDDENNWPSAVITDLDPEDPAIRRRAVFVAMAVIDEVGKIDLTKFSNWARVRRVVAWVIRFAENCRNVKSNRSLDECLTVGEIEVAERFIIKDVQHEAFDAEMKAIRNGDPVSAKSKLSSLNPFINNDGILCVGGRLRRLDIPESVKHPAILPRTHPITTMILEWIHCD